MNEEREKDAECEEGRLGKLRKSNLGSISGSEELRVEEFIFGLGDRNIFRGRKNHFVSYFGARMRSSQEDRPGS